LELERIPFNPRQLLAELLDIFRPPARGKNLAVLADIDAAVPENLVGDPKRLRQIIAGLLSNAIKYTQNGHISIRLQATATPGLIQASIKDTGIGISKPAQDTLFTAFSQADMATPYPFGGIDLNLASCAHLTRMIGGRIWVDSEPGQGATFHFTFLSWQSPPQQTAPLPTHTDNTAALAHLRLLLVEDDLLNRTIAGKLIAKIGIKPDTANDGLQALVQVGQNTYDIILMDMQMPNMDGLTATRHIRAMGHIHQPYIIALTGNALDEDAQACKAAGMDDFLSKPINTNTLFAKLLHYAAASQPHVP